MPTFQEIQEAAGVGRTALRAAIAGNELDPADLRSVSRWVAHKREAAEGFVAAQSPLESLRAALRDLRLGGCTAQRLSFGTFAWLREGEAAFRFAAELGSPLAELAPTTLQLPPFSPQLALLDKLVCGGRGLEPQAVALHAQLGGWLGPDDPVLRRFEVRRVRPKARRARGGAR